MKSCKRGYEQAAILATVVAVGLGGCKSDGAEAESRTSYPARAAPGLGCEDSFRSLDTNDDGQISRDEFMAVQHRGSNPGAVFDHRDVDESETLTLAEFCSGGGHGRGMGPGMGHGRGMGPAGPGRRCAAMFQRLDTNEDGKVTESEFLAVDHRIPDPKAEFARRDKNGDGSLTLSEFCQVLGASAGASSADLDD
ncbi:MAG: EF-hand domain-containing protein [Myxococcota bacterium]